MAPDASNCIFDGDLQMAGSHSSWWKAPGSEAGNSYPETAVTSRVAGSVTESELQFFASKIGQLEQQARAAGAISVCSLRLH